MMIRSKLLLLSMLGVLPLLSCSDFWPTGEPEVPAGRRFQQLERRLLQAETIHIEGGAGSTGTVESAFEGKAILAKGTRTTSPTIGSRAPSRASSASRVTGWMSKNPTCTSSTTRRRKKRLIWPAPAIARHGHPPQLSR